MTMDDKYKVLITTSGLGSRLGELTNYTNKALIRIGKKPAISYVIESYPEDIEFVITVGYFGQQVIDFLELAYPNRKFTFVEVDKYNGLGSSLVYSMLKAESELQCPFIFHACDTLLPDEEIPKPDCNWILGHKADETEQKSNSHYRTFRAFNDSHVMRIDEKGQQDYDYEHIGVIGINSWKEFWYSASSLYKHDGDNSSLSDCNVINQMLESDFSIEFHNSSPIRFKFFGLKTAWLDIGNMDSLRRAREIIKDKFKILDKLEESIFIFEKEGFVIKWFFYPYMVSKRVKRAKILADLVPKILETRDNFYKYEYVEGDLFADSANIGNFKQFLKWSKTNLWKKLEDQNEEHYDRCYDFYFEKTQNRVGEFLKRNKLQDKMDNINGFDVPTVKNMLDMIDKDSLCDVDQYQFHGDFILDNIILQDDKTFKLLDWRQDFGGDLESGDIFYDIAKLNHNLVFNHKIVNQKLFTIEYKKDGKIKCDLLRSSILTECQEILFKFFKNKTNYSFQNFDKKVKVLTSLIWLNMSALHCHPLDSFLFYFGRYNLWRALNG